MEETLDHKALIASLAPETRRALCAQSDGPGLVRIGVQFGLIGALGGYIHLGMPLWQAALLPQGLLIIFLFTALHETIHGTAFRSGWMNVWAARLCGFAVFLTPQHFRYFHFAHHRFTHDPDRDPELAAPKPRTWGAYAVYMTGLPEWAWRVKQLVRTALLPNEDPFVPERGKARIRLESQIFLVLYSFVFALAGAALLWTWILPLLLAGPFMRAYLLAEHTFCPHVADMLSNTRTTFTNRAVRWLAWNMPYHAEHHAYPAVPFHKLPEFHALTRAHLRETEQGYTRFNKRYLRTIEA